MPQNRTREDLFPLTVDDAAVTDYTHKLRNNEHKTDATKSQEPRTLNT